LKIVESRARKASFLLKIILLSYLIRIVPTKFQGGVRCHHVLTIFLTKMISPVVIPMIIPQRRNVLLIHPAKKLGNV
jgi:hypothetical protein